MAGLRFFCMPPPYGHNDVLQPYDLPVTGQRGEFSNCAHASSLRRSAVKSLKMPSCVNVSSSDAACMPL